jgi:UDP-glucose 4-epimerase
MIIWITGAKGFIGQHLARHFAARGDTVLGLGHGFWPEATAEAGLTLWLNGEIAGSNLTSLRATHGAPDLVVHLAGGSSVGAAIANPREDFARTVTTTAELLEWLRLESMPTRFVAVSSAAVHGVGHAGRIAESASTQPLSPYGYHKLMMEQLCRSYASCYGLKCLVLRLFSVYGPGLRKQLLWDLCRRLQDTPHTIELSGTGDELRDWTHVSDVLRAIEATADLASPKVPTFNVGSGRTTSVREVAQTVIDCFAAGGQRSKLQFNEKVRAGDPFSLVADPSRLQALGFDWSISPRQGIVEYVRWFQGLTGTGRSS